MRVARGPLGIPLPSMQGPRPCVESVPDFRIPLQCFMDLGGLLDSPQGSQSSSRVGACTCSFLPSCISSVRLPFTCIKGSVSFPRVFPTRLSHEAFPRGFPTRLSHRSVPRAIVVSVDPRLESRGSEGKRDFPEWTEISGGLWEWWHNPGVPLAFPVESASS